MLRVITFYQRWISPMLPPRCRFIPTCSSYAAEAISHYGVARGSTLAMRRICKCHPFHPGGYDPVPMDDCATARAGEPLTSTDTEKVPTQRQNTLN